jgi:predicted dehydrogenase
MTDRHNLNVVLVGCGFMGRAHSNAYRQVNAFYPNLPYNVVRKVIVDIDEAAVKGQSAQQGWQEWSTDLAAVLKRPDIDMVDVATSNDSHYSVAMQVIAAGKNIACEKPLALTVAQAREMAEAAKKKNLRTMIWHNYRRAPAATTAAQLIADGKIGEIRHIRATYLQDWLADDSCPYLWRMNAKLAGSGAHGDLNAHLIDMTRFMTGLEFTEVCGMGETFIKQRKMPNGQGFGTVDVDDAFIFMARMSNGAIASFEATRAAPGRKNYNKIEINGTKGSLVWNFERMNELEFFSTEDEALTQGFRNIMCMNNGAHPYAANFWPDGHVLGYEHTFVNALADFVTSLKEGTAFRPDFADAVASQEVLEASLESDKKKAWVTVPHSQTFAGPAVKPRAASTKKHVGL